jgi:hypothetical protein
VERPLTPEEKRPAREPQRVPYRLMPHMDPEGRDIQAAFLGGGLFLLACLAIIAGSLWLAFHWRG